MADEEPMVFNIPMNFAEEGTMLGGRVKSKNLLETVIFFVLLIQPIFALQTEGRIKVYLAVLIVLPVCIFSLIGVQGESLSSFGMAALYFVRTRRIWGKPDEKERMERGYRERRRQDAQKRNTQRTEKRKAVQTFGAKIQKRK